LKSITKMLARLFRKDRNLNPPRPSLESLLSRIFTSDPPAALVKTLSPETFARKLESLPGALTADFRGSDGVSRGVLILPEQAERTGKTEERDDPRELLDRLPSALPRLFFIGRGENAREYHLDFSFVLPGRIRKENRRGVENQAEGSEIFSVEVPGQGEFFLLAEQPVTDRLRRLYPGDGEFVAAVEAFLFGGDAHPREEGESLTMTVSRPEQFMAGRFFLPGEIARNPEPIRSRFLSATSTREGEKYLREPGFWFRVTLVLDGETFPVHYFFKGISLDAEGKRKDVFRQLFRMILRKTVSSFRSCGFQVSSVRGDFGAPPGAESLSSSLLMDFQIQSARFLIRGYTAVTLNLITRILDRILPPWAFRYWTDSLLARLKTLLSLNAELYATGRMEIYERYRSEEGPSHSPGDPLGDLRKNMIKLNELLELLSLREARTIVSNLLYRKGWTGSRLRTLFFFREYAGTDPEGEPVYIDKTLIDFDEVRFRTFLMRNMLDQWDNSGTSGPSLEEGLLIHFQLLRLIREESGTGAFFSPSPLLLSVLESEFSAYREGLEAIIAGLPQDRVYLDYRDWHIPQLTVLLNALPQEILHSLFRYTPEDLSRFRPVLPSGRYQEVARSLTDADREPDDRALETILLYRKRIREILASPPPDDYN